MPGGDGNLTGKGRGARPECDATPAAGGEENTPTASVLFLARYLG